MAKPYCLLSSFAFLQIPQLLCFDEKITFFETLRSEIAELKTPVDICWLRINAQPAKVQLSQLATSWASYYTEFLLNCCLSRADSVTSFISKMDAFLSTKPPSEDSEEPPDTETLYKFMTHIRDVKIASDPIKQLLGPLHEQVSNAKLIKQPSTFLLMRLVAVRLVAHIAATATTTVPISDDTYSALLWDSNDAFGWLRVSTLEATFSNLLSSGLPGSAASEARVLHS